MTQLKSVFLISLGTGILLFIIKSMISAASGIDVLACVVLGILLGFGWACMNPLDFHDEWMRLSIIFNIISVFVAIFGVSVIRVGEFIGDAIFGEKGIICNFFSLLGF